MCSASAPLFMCIVSLSRYSCPTFLAPIKLGSFKTKFLSVFCSWHCYFYEYFQPCPLYHSSWNLTFSSMVRKISSLSAWQYLVAISGPLLLPFRHHFLAVQRLRHTPDVPIPDEVPRFGTSIGRSSTVKMYFI